MPVATIYLAMFIHGQACNVGISSFRSITKIKLCWTFFAFVLSEKLTPKDLKLLFRFPVPARPRISVEKLSLLCNLASGGTFSSTAIELYCIDGYITAVANAKVYPFLEAWGKAWEYPQKR